MNQKYMKAEMEIISFEEEDIITASDEYPVLEDSDM